MLSKYSPELSRHKRGRAGHGALMLLSTNEGYCEGVGLLRV